MLEKNEFLIDKVNDLVKKRALRPAMIDVDIVKAELGPDAVAIGAALAAYKNMH